MICVRHRSASSVSDGVWEYVPESQTIVLFWCGRGIEIPVCGEANPRTHAYALTRKSETTFQVAPAMFTIARDGVWSAVAIGFDETLSEFVWLTHSTPDVTTQLERLVRPPMNEKKPPTRPPEFFPPEILSHFHDSIPPSEFGPEKTEPGIEQTLVHCPICSNCLLCRGIGLVTPSTAAEYARRLRLGLTEDPKDP